MAKADSKSKSDPKLSEELVKAANETALVLGEDAPMDLAADEYADDEGRGFENQTADDRKIPMLVVLQFNSPLVKKKEAQAGQIVNSVTGQVYDFVDVVPAITDHGFTEWIPRNPDGTGGGFRGRHKLNAPVVAQAKANNGGRVVGKLPVRHVDAKGFPMLDKDNKPLPDTELVETFEIAGIVFQGWTINPATKKLEPVHEGGQNIVGPIMIPFASTKIKSYRAWSTNVGYYMAKVPIPGPDGKPSGKVKKTTVPMFSHRIRLGTKLEERGTQSWYIFTIDPLFAADGDKSGMDRSLISKNDPRYIAAKMLCEAHESGAVEGNYRSTESEQETPGQGGAPAQGDAAF